MEQKIQQLKNRALEELKKIKSSEELKDLKTKYLGRKGELTKILRGIKDLVGEEKSKIGKLGNEIKADLEEFITQAQADLGLKTSKISQGWLDVTLPGKKAEPGHLHPLTMVKDQLEDVFAKMGFISIEGPELESEYYNFEAINIPETHPARDTMDTFFIKDKSAWVMRTHTSSQQVRALEKYGAPLRAIFPGRCFRYEATDASHETTFYQLEGLMVDKDISVAHLIAVMKALLRGIFKREVKIRMRPGYFPFVEPGFELDINCLICSGAGCSVCKQSGWLELLPCGLVHPRVLEAGGLDPKEYSGFAFGLGLTRLAMMKYGIDDIRLFLSGDLRFLKQF